MPNREKDFCRRISSSLFVLVAFFVGSPDDIVLSKTQVGCPVFDSKGIVRGIALACRGCNAKQPGPSSVLLSHVVRRMIKLRNGATVAETKELARHSDVRVTD